MGVWIETLMQEKLLGKIAVTPCMGVWIETYYNLSSTPNR